VSDSPSSRTERAARRRRGFAAALTTALLVGAPVASALVAVRSHVRVDVPVRDPLIEFYDYATGAPVAWTSSTDFEAGTLVSLDASGDALVLAGGAGPPWWDADWTGRGCYTIDHAAPGASSVTEYPVRIELDTAALITGGEMLADGADLRAVSDTAVELPLWLEGPAGAADAEVWVQVDTVPAGGTAGFCLYWGNPSASPVSDAAAVFTYSTEKPLYVTVTDRNITATAFTVVSLVKGNRITNGISTSPTRNEGSSHTFPAGEQSAATVFSALGPVTSRGVGNGQDTLVPISWSATEFVVPTQRGTQRFSVHAPFADASVVIFDGKALRAGRFTVPAGTTTSLDADVTGSNAGIVVSTVPVLLFHTAGSNDAFAVPPPSTDPLYGVRSTNAKVGFVATTSGVVTRSNGGTITFTGWPRGSAATSSGGGAQGGGPGDGFRIAADRPIVAVQQADGDGTESSVFLPERELGSAYYLPTGAEYLSVVCPETGITVRVDPPGGGPSGRPTDLVCAGPPGGPGWARHSAGVAAETWVYTPGGEPFYAYYEDDSYNGEANLLGLKQGRQYTWPEPAVTPAPDGGYAPAGTWESATLDTGDAGVFGTLAFTADMPPGTTVRVRVATAATDPPTVFVGPDGTAATWYDGAEQALAAVHDGDRYLRVRTELATGDPGVTPRLDDLTITHSLTRFVHDAGEPDVAAVTGTVGSAGRHWIARVRTSAPALAGSSATVSLDSVTGLSFLALAEISTTPPPAPAVRISSGVVVLSSGPPVAFDAASPHSIVLDEQITGPAAITVVWRLDAASSGTPVVERLLRIEVAP